MGQKSKNHKQKQKNKDRQQNPTTREPLNNEILDSIGSPNAWTPAVEDIWINELHKMSAGEIYRRFPPIKKPPNVRKRPKGSGWGDKIVP